MPMTILATKLYVPPPSPRAVSRPHLLELLDAGMSRKLTLVCAPAGFGKSTLLSDWVNACQYPSAWLSLDADDGDISRFLAYLIAALQTISETVGAGVSNLLDATPAPSAESVLTVLLNSLSSSQSMLVLVLDDYHLLASQPVDRAMAFLIDHLPPQVQLVISSREEPELSLGRLRGQGQLVELGQADLRFGQQETAGFLSQTMGLQLSAANIAALETRTEGWVAGLQLAAISLRGDQDPDAFVKSFTGSHRFVQDYLVEEVLRRQNAVVLSFLLHTSVLDRMCGPLCDAVLQSDEGHQHLDYLVQSNLFLIPLDNERRWYRYHHLFRDLLRQRLQQGDLASTCHVRASEWYEANGWEIEAFHQAVAAPDIVRATRLLEGNGMPLYFRGEMVPVIQWLESQPQHVLDACPSLWIQFAWSLLLSGKFSRIRPKLSCAEGALRRVQSDASSEDLFGQIATLWSWLAVYEHKADEIYAQATRALALLRADNQPARTAARCALGVALLYRGEHDAAAGAFGEVVALGRSSGNVMFTVVASIALAGIHVTNNQLHAAAAMYRDVLSMITDPTHTVGREAHIGLANILYEWNALDDADVHARLSSELAANEERYFGSADALRARLMLARDDDGGAAALLAEANIVAQTKQAAQPMQELAPAQVLVMLRRGDIAGAAHLVGQQPMPLFHVRVCLAQGNAGEALARVQSYRHEMAEQGLHNEVLKAMVLQALALHALGRQDQASAAEAMRVLHDALVLAQPSGFVRLFADEGATMIALLACAEKQGIFPDYVGKLLGALAPKKVAGHQQEAKKSTLPSSVPRESYSPRELEILRLIHQGRSNQEIGERLFLSLSTVKWHNQNIFAKLQVQRRTEAVARALELNLMAY